MTDDIQNERRTPTPYRQIRAVYDAATVRVYQAFSDEIADAALQHRRFVSPPFLLTRTTWIKPSFLWMMYRSDWARKDPGQARVLAVDLRRDGFDWALANGFLSHYDPRLPFPQEEWQQRARSSPVVIQWDPERSIRLGPLDHRAIQIGLKPAAAERYVSDWIATITDITPFVRTLASLVEAGNTEQATSLLPVEREYPVDEQVRRRLAITD